MKNEKLVEATMLALRGKLVESKDNKNKKLSKKTEGFWSSDMLTWEDWLQEWFEDEVNRRVNENNIDISNMTDYEIDELDDELYDTVREDIAANEDELKKEYEKYIQDYIDNADDYIKQLKGTYKARSKKL